MATHKLQNALCCQSFWMSSPTQTTRKADLIELLNILDGARRPGFEERSYLDSAIGAPRCLTRSSSWTPSET
jgi:hypothetical protein